MPILNPYPADDSGYKHKCIQDEQKVTECPSHGETCYATKCEGCDKVTSDCGEFGD